MMKQQPPFWNRMWFRVSMKRDLYAHRTRNASSTKPFCSSLFFSLLRVLDRHALRRCRLLGGNDVLTRAHGVCRGRIRWQIVLGVVCRRHCDVVTVVVRVKDMWLWQWYGAPAPTERWYDVMWPQFLRWIVITNITKLRSCYHHSSTIYHCNASRRVFFETSER